MTTEIDALRAEFKVTARTLKTVSQDEIFKKVCRPELVELVSQTLAIRAVQDALPEGDG